MYEGTCLKPAEMLREAVEEELGLTSTQRRAEKVSKDLYVPVALVQKYSLCLHKSTCFTGTKVQILARVVVLRQPVVKGAAKQQVLLT
jgi:hypothetical protein